MSAKITIDILESYPQCKYKCYLQLLGEQGPPSAYEQLMRDTRHCLRLAARDALLSQYGASESVCHRAATTTLLAQSAPLLWDTTLEDERLSVRFDALQRVPGPSQLGDFHYIPVFVHEAERPSQHQRSLLGFPIVSAKFWWLRSAERMATERTLQLLSDTFVPNE